MQLITNYELHFLGNVQHIAFNKRQTYLSTVNCSAANICVLPDVYTLIIVFILFTFLLYLFDINNIWKKLHFLCVKFLIVFFYERSKNHLYYSKKSAHNLQHLGKGGIKAKNCKQSNFTSSLILFYILPNFKFCTAFCKKIDLILLLHIFSYHQKYRLQQHRDLTKLLGLNSLEDLVSSHIAARLNGYVVGRGGVKQFDAEAPKLGINEELATEIRKYVAKHEGQGLFCWECEMKSKTRILCILS